MYDFIAIDFETANSKRSSACAIGIVAVEGHEIVDTFYSLINPTGQSFNPINISVHGITPEMVKNSPTLDELIPRLTVYFNEHIPVVAHNATFDISVLRLSTNEALPNFIYVDSMEIAAPLVQGNRNLENCARALSIELNNHHNAAEDAAVSAEIALKGLDSLNCITMWEYIAKADHVRKRYFHEIKPQKSESQHVAANRELYGKWRGNKAEAVPTVSEISESGALFGKNIVFTGDLTITRFEAKQIAVNAGAIVKSSVSKKVDYLVVGVQDKALVGDDGLSSKEEYAYELNNSGEAHIVFLNEEQFIALSKSEVHA